MALINPPAWLQQGSYPAKTDRQVLESLVENEGVLTGFDVSPTATPSMSVNIAAGKAFIAGTSVALQGMYNVINDARATVMVPGSDISHPRYDLIVVSVSDADVAGSTNSVDFKVISGVPQASPVVPTIPPSTLVLARVFVGAGVSTITPSAITDVRIFTAPRGSIINVPDNAARLRLSNPRPGSSLYVHDQSTGFLWKNTGSSWRSLDSDTGWVSVPPAEGFQSSVQVRAINGVVYIRGAFSPLVSGGSIAAVFIQVGTVPSGFRPSSQITMATAINVNANLQAVFSPSGTITVRTFSGATNTSTNTAINFSGSWPID